MLATIIVSVLLIATLLTNNLGLFMFGLTVFTFVVTTAYDQHQAKNSVFSRVPHKIYWVVGWSTGSFLACMLVVDILLGHADQNHPLVTEERVGPVTIKYSGELLGLCTPFHRNLHDLEFEDCIQFRYITDRAISTVKSAEIAGILDGEQKNYVLTADFQPVPRLRNAVVVIDGRPIIIGDLH